MQDHVVYCTFDQYISLPSLIRNRENIFLICMHDFRKIVYMNVKKLCARFISSNYILNLHAQIHLLSTITEQFGQTTLIH